MIEHETASAELRSETTVLSVIAPCFNEQENVDPLVDRMLAAFEESSLAAELILVDDGSSDETWARIAARSESDVRVRAVRHESNRGMEQAWRSGFDLAYGQLICLIDADLQNRPEDVAKLYRMYLSELPDVVQAVRHPGPDVRRGRMFSRALNVLLNLVFRTRLRDNKSGFILCRRDVLTHLLQHRYRYRYFQSFIGVAAISRGYSIAEVDTDFDPRHAGSSFLSRFPVVVSLRIVWELVKFRVECGRVGASRPVPQPIRWPTATMLSKTAGGQV